jgi:hypothetical protein
LSVAGGWLLNVKLDQHRDMLDVSGKGGAHFQQILQVLKLLESCVVPVPRGARKRHRCLAGANGCKSI